VSAGSNIVCVPTPTPVLPTPPSSNPSTISSSTSAIQILSPNGGQTYQPGNTVSITWSAPGVTTANNSFGLNIYDAVLKTQKIVLTQTVGNAVSNGQVSPNGVFNWMVPSSVPPGNYLVYMSWGNTYDESNAPFAIVGGGQASAYSLPVVKVAITPHVLTLGQPFTITWSSAYATSCTAVGPTGSAWAGAQAISGSQSIIPPAVGTGISYNIQCSGPGGTANSGDTVSVTSN
jgi:hypothetical protein